ncbi:MAG TPA: TlpA disulfide reductase family protein [Motilibacteraceae bacterium]|nr:TlpA disulfide reductase family protein [Motilibacteraceae bacterium]
MSIPSPAGRRHAQRLGRRERSLPPSAALRPLAVLALVLLALAGCGSGSRPASGTGAATPLPPLTPDPAAVRAAGLAPCPATASAAPVADGLPDVTLPCLGSGPAVRLSDLRGTPTVLNVWGQWCGPCREEAPHFQALHAAAGDKVRVLGVDFDDDPTAALRFAASLGLTYPSLMDQDGALKVPFRILGARGLPLTYFVDAQGKVVGQKVGPVKDDAELRALVKRYLGVSV